MLKTVHIRESAGTETVRSSIERFTTKWNVNPYADSGPGSLNMARKERRNADALDVPAHSCFDPPVGGRILTFRRFAVFVIR